MLPSWSVMRIHQVSLSSIYVKRQSSWEVLGGEELAFKIWRQTWRPNHSTWTTCWQKEHYIFPPQHISRSNLLKLCYCCCFSTLLWHFLEYVRKNKGKCSICWSTNLAAHHRRFFIGAMSELQNNGLLSSKDLVEDLKILQHRITPKLSENSCNACKVYAHFWTWNLTTKANKYKWPKIPRTYLLPFCFLWSQEQPLHYNDHFQYIPHCRQKETKIENCTYTALPLLLLLPKSSRQNSLTCHLISDKRTMQRNHRPRPLIS